MKDLLQTLVFGGLFLVLFLPLYVENSFFFPFITGKNFAFRIIVEIVFASWILLALYDVKYRPKFSWIIATFGGLLAVMAVANATGEYPLKSFWSNFERMDGYVTLLHIFLYMMVLGSVMHTKKLWSWFLHTSIVVALMVAVYGLMQYFGPTGADRVDSRLGNSAYMAVYMLFHLFFLGLLAVRTKAKTHHLMYGAIGLIFVYTLLLTGTRGAFLGFVGGSVAAVSYIALFGRQMPHLRKYAIGGMFALVVFGLTFVGVRDMQFIQETPALSRIANIDLQRDLAIRSTIWSMAWEGVQERPLLGWGQGNFNYVFNEQYKPELFGQEQWFDRVHNIFFDWLIAGGFLGFIAYFSIMLAALYYLFVEPVILKRTSSFTLLEQAVLVGLLVAYLMHNLVVFDNIISYIFYGTVLALIHSRVSRPVKAIEKFSITPVMVTQFVTPLMIIVTGFTIYFVNVPGMQTSGDMIDALIAPDVPGRLLAFHTALGRDSFANQEVVEQLAQQAMTIVRNPNVPQQDKQNMVQRAELELLKLIEEKPGDARLHNFLSAFYRAIGAVPQSREQAAIAVSLSPGKPALILEQAIIELQAGDNDAARVFLQKAFELEEKNAQARVLYASVLMRIGDIENAKELIGKTYLPVFSQNAYALASAEVSGDMEFLASVFNARIDSEPNNPQHRASLAFIYYKLGDTERSVDVLTQAAELIPSFASTSACYVSNIENGTSPDEGCQ